MKGLTVRDIAEICGGRILRGDPEGMPCRISTDSREELENALFVPVIGERTDGHKYLCQVAEKGAAAAFTSEGDPFADDAAGIPESFALIAVDDTVKALQDLGAGCRKLHPIPLVGVTGSVGKTSTREIIAAALSAGKKVFRTKGNHNSQIGVPITLSELSDEDEIGVIEMGMSNFGEMSRLSRMVRPDAAVFTNVGEAHLEILGSKENIRSEKLHIQDCMPEQAVLFVNGDDPLLRDCPLREGVRRVRYGTSEGCDVRAVNIDLSHGRPKFEVLAGEERIPVSLNVYGMHHVLNASAALAVAKEYGVDLRKAAEAVAEFRGYRHRQQMTERDGILVFDDAYNASPLSMKASLDILENLNSGGRRIAVLGDMKELGAEEAEMHFGVGKQLGGKRQADLLFTLGDLSREIAAGVLAAEKEMNIPEADRIPVRSFDDRETLYAALLSEVKAGDTVLFKSSNSLKLYELADRLGGNAE